MEKETSKTAEEKTREKKTEVQMISVIIPVKPPEPYLDTLIVNLHQVLSNVPHEVLIQKEKGLGYAVKCGIARSRGNIIIVMDADGSHDPKYLPNMLSLLEDYDVVIGSKRVVNGSNEDSFLRRQISSLYNKLIKWMLGIQVYDSMSGFIVAKSFVFDGYKFPRGYKFMLPLYYQKGNYKILEYPISFHKRKAGRSKVSYMEGFKTLFQVFKLRLIGSD